MNVIGDDHFPLRPIIRSLDFLRFSPILSNATSMVNLFVQYFSIGPKVSVSIYVHPLLPFEFHYRKYVSEIDILHYFF